MKRGFVTSRGICGLQEELPIAVTNACALRESLSAGHTNPVNIWNTTDEERAEKLSEYLDSIKEICSEPQLMPLNNTGKHPAITGKCALGSQEEEAMLHTRQEAINALKEGATGFALYAGRSEHGTENLVFADHDEMETFPLDTLPNTLTVVSGSGQGFHETFLNGGDVENAKGKKKMNNAGEIRANNWYVVLPGSIHPTGGIYHIKEKRSIAKLSANDIPKGLRPSTLSYKTGEIEMGKIPSQNVEFTNELGMTLTDVRKYDHIIDDILYTTPRPKDDSVDESSIDAELVRRLCYHHFEQRDIISIWKQYRMRSKLNRDDYIRRTVQRCGSHKDRCHYIGIDSDISSGISEFNNDRGSRDTDPDITLDTARQRCQARINSALLNKDCVLIDALPAMGKSSGIIRGAATTDTLITVFTARHDLYGQYSQWCEQHDLSYQRLPSFHHDCPTAQGEYGEDWQKQIMSLYERGVMAGEIHKHAKRYFGEFLPCDDGQECPYKQGWDFDKEEHDVLIGHYQHAYNPTIVEGRTAVFDEFPASAFLETLDSDTVIRSVSAYLSDCNRLPFEDYTELLEGRNSKQGAKAREWLEEQKLERDSEPVLTGESDNTHTLAPLIVYALLHSEDLGNGWEYVNLDYGKRMDSTCRTAARNRASGELTLLLPPPLDDAKGVICLDGTPTPSLWKRTVDHRLDHRQTLNNEERAAYLSKALGLSITQMTEAVRTYSSGKYVKVDDEKLLFEAISDREGTDPALISTAKAIEQYENADALGSIKKYEHYGNLKGSNKFEHEQVGIIVGSQHYGDEYLERWGALAGKCVKRNGGKGIDLNYGDFGNQILHHMREHEVLQAVLRFGRGGSGASVYVYTCALPDWVPITGTGEIRQWSRGMQEIIAALESESRTEWKTSEIADEVSISERQVRGNLSQLTEDGIIEKQEEGRGYLWICEDREINPLHQVQFR